MASSELSAIMERIIRLSADEQLELIAYLDKQTQEMREVDPPRIKWRDVMGASPTLLGDDTQEWVSQARIESDEQRSRFLKNMP